MVNMVEGRRVLEHLEAHPEQYDQLRWFGDGVTVESVEWDCGTTACVAGWTCLLNGWAVWSNSMAPIVVSRDGVRRRVDEVARELLDLTELQAVRLFVMCDTAEGARGYLRTLVTDQEREVP